MPTLTGAREKEQNMRKEDDGRIGDGHQSNGQEDMFCRTVVAAVAAMLALKLCQYVRKYVMKFFQ